MSWVGILESLVMLRGAFVSHRAISCHHQPHSTRGSKTHIRGNGAPQQPQSCQRLSAWHFYDAILVPGHSLFMKHSVDARILRLDSVVFVPLSHHATSGKSPCARALKNTALHGIRLIHSEPLHYLTPPLLHANPLESASERRWPRIFQSKKSLAEF